MNFNKFKCSFVLLYALSLSLLIFFILRAFKFSSDNIANNSNTQASDKWITQPGETDDPYIDLMAVVLGQMNENQAHYKNIVVRLEESESNPSLAELMDLENRDNSTNLDRFYYTIHKKEMYSEGDKYVQDLLQDMSQLPIKKIYELNVGAQMKLLARHSNGMLSLVKLNRFSREYQKPPNRYFFDDIERTNAEVAAFYLDRILGFRRAIPITGRILNMTSELAALAELRVAISMYISPLNNICYPGYCVKYCSFFYAVCGHPHTVESSFAAFLPTHELAQRKAWSHPWQRSYDVRKKAVWEVREKDYCDMVRNVPPYDSGRRLLDLMDMAVFDFLIGNMDRHHYETFNIFGDDTFPIHMNQGLSFGEPFHDEISILAPMLQCCLIRSSTLERLLIFHNGPKKLSEALEEVMANDPVAPVLWEPHFEALDRRVGIILKGIRECLKHSVTKDIPK